MCIHLLTLIPIAVMIHSDTLAYYETVVHTIGNYMMMGFIWRSYLGFGGTSMNHFSF